VQKINSNHLLKVDGLSVSFVTRNGIVRAVEDISFTVNRGKTTAIIGESGSGKSVSCYSLLGLIPTPPGKIDSGSAIFDGQDLLRLSDERLRSIVGLRVEMFQQYYTGSNSQQGVDLKNERIIDKLDIFPSVNLIYAVNEKANLRAAYYKTTARPSFKEASIAEIYDPLDNLVFVGNIDIKPTYIDNVDLRFERFGEKAEMIAISAFYKRFTDPIELAFVAASTSNFTPLNLGDANVYGVEFELRKNLGFISGLDIFDLKINTSFIEAFQKFSDDELLLRTNALRDGQTLGDGRALQGQSPYLINAALEFKLEGSQLQGNLGYNIQGKTLEVVGDGFYPDVYTMPFQSLNLNIIKGIGDNHTFTLKVSNLLDDNRESYFESYGATSQIFSNRNIGRSFSIGYSFSID